MKASHPQGNFLIVDPAARETFCPDQLESLSPRERGIGSVAQALAGLSSVWVYFAQPKFGELFDAAGGIRMISWSESLMDCFGNLDGVLVIDGIETADRIRKLRPDVPVFVWQTELSTKPGFSGQLELDSRCPQLAQTVEKLVFSVPAAPIEPDSREGSQPAGKHRNAA